MTLLFEGFVVLICCFVVAYVFSPRSEDKKSLQVALVGVGSFAGVATVADVATVATVADVPLNASLPGWCFIAVFNVTTRDLNWGMSLHNHRHGDRSLAIT